MFLDSPTGRGSAASTTTGTSKSVNVTAAIPVGAVVVVRGSSSIEPTILTDGASAHHTGVADTVGNVYEKVGEASKGGDGGFEASVTGSLWLCKVTVEIPNGSAITISYDASYKGRVIAVEEYQLEVPEATLEVTEVAVATGRGTPLSVTCTPTAEDEFTWLFAGAHDQQNASVLGLPSGWTTDRAKVSADGGSFSSSTLWGQYRQLQAGTQTWAGTTTDGSARWVVILAAVLVVLPVPPAPEPGTREYQADFETETACVDRTTTDRRPDAVSRDYRTAYTIGPVALGDVSGGMYARIWRARAEPGAVYLAGQNAAGTDFDAEELLCSYTGADIDELDLAFTETGTIVLVAEKATGGGGSAQVHIYWFNEHPMVLAYEWKVPFDGRTPRCVTDYFPTTVGPHVCPPEIDVQVFYLTTGGMYRREESSTYSTAFATVLPNSSLTRLQQAFRTTDRRVSVLYSQRNVATGRWQFRRVDSVPYRDSLLVRPTFLNWSSPFRDIMQTGDEAYRTVGTETNDWNLRVQSNDDVDAIEVAAIADWPTGALPDFDQQEQEYAPGGGIAVGGYWDFTFSITHGDDTMSLKAFRARTRKVVLGVTCYSPWRYTLIPAGAPAKASPGDLSVNCDRDRILDLPYRNAFIRHGYVEGVRTKDTSSRADPYPTACLDGSPFSESDVLAGGTHPGWWFVGGDRNTAPSYPFPTHEPNFSVRRRAFEEVDFTDEDGRYNGVVVGETMESTAQGVPPEYDWPGTRFPRQFPDDTGAWPTPPATDDIIAES